MEIIIYLAVAVVAFAGGIGAGRYLLRSLFKKQEIAAESKAKTILKDAENNAELLKKNRLLEAKEKFLQLKSDHEKTP
jgi:ribonucrease Y